MGGSLLANPELLKDLLRFLAGKQLLALLFKKRLIDSQTLRTIINTSLVKKLGTMYVSPDTYLKYKDLDKHLRQVKLPASKSTDINNMVQQYSISTELAFLILATKELKNSIIVTKTHLSKEIFEKYKVHTYDPLLKKKDVKSALIKESEGELTKFVRRAKAKGFSEETIRNKLLEVGWSRNEVDSAFKNLK